MTPRLTFALVALLGLGGGALAQGTAEQRSACTPDVWRLCSSQIPNVAAITGCLKAERARLSPACRSAMGGAEPPAEAVAEGRPAAPPPERAAARRSPDHDSASRREAPQRAAEKVAPAKVAAAKDTRAKDTATRSKTAKAAPADAAPTRTARNADAGGASTRRIAAKPARSQDASHRSVAEAPRASAPRRRVAGRDEAGSPYLRLAGLGLNRREMAEARYWMRTIGAAVQGGGGLPTELGSVDGLFRLAD